MFSSSLVCAVCHIVDTMNINIGWKLSAFCRRMTWIGVVDTNDCVHWKLKHISYELALNMLSKMRCYVSSMLDSFLLLSLQFTMHSNDDDSVSRPPARFQYVRDCFWHVIHLYAYASHAQCQAKFVCNSGHKTVVMQSPTPCVAFIYFLFVFFLGIFGRSTRKDSSHSFYLIQWTKIFIYFHRKIVSTNSFYDLQHTQRSILMHST